MYREHGPPPLIRVALGFAVYGLELNPYLGRPQPDLQASAGMFECRAWPKLVSMWEAGIIASVSVLKHLCSSTLLGRAGHTR